MEKGSQGDADAPLRESSVVGPRESMSRNKLRPIDLLHQDSRKPSFELMPNELREHILEEKGEQPKPVRAVNHGLSSRVGLRLEIMKEHYSSSSRLNKRKSFRGQQNIERRESVGLPIPRFASASIKKGNERVVSRHISHHDHDDHLEECLPPWIFSVLSGLILGMFMYVTCSVFGILMFEVDERLYEFDMYGTYMALAGFIVSGFITTTFSKCQIMISGPDINPILFLIEAALIISNRMPDAASDELLATVVFTVIYATFIVAVLFFLIGRFKMTNFVQFMPAAVLNGFLASVGVLIVKEAIVVATGYHWEEKYLKDMWTTWYAWKLILPALPIAFPLYFLKRYHVIHPSILIPMFLFVPLIIFYIILAATGISIDEAREQGWFFHVLERKPFYEDWGAIWLSLDKISWPAFTAAQPTIWVMQIVVIMDTLVKLTGVERAVGFNLDFDKEIELMGVANMVAFFGISVPTYGLTSFTTLNKATIHRVGDRTPGYIAVAFCAIFYFIGFPLMNYMPRFLCAGLILYKGIGVLAENTVDASRRLSKLEMLAVLGIVVIAYFQGLVLAVVTGIVLSSFIFVVQYARRYDIKNRWTLRTYHSSVVRLLLERQKLEQLGERMYALQMRGYLFFGSAIKVLRLITDECAKRSGRFEDKLSHVVLDFAEVTGMDGAAAGMFLKIQRFCTDSKVQLLFSSLSPKLQGKLAEQEVERVEEAFPTFDHAVECVEEAVLEQAQIIRSKWFIIPDMIKMHCLASHTVFAGHFDELFSETHIAKYCTSLTKKEGDVLYRMGEELNQIWMLHRGKVALTVRKYTENGRTVDERVSVLKTGVVSQTLPGMLCSETATCLSTSTLITIDKKHLHELTEKYPFDVLKLQRLVIQDIAETKSQLEHKTEDLQDDAFLKQQLLQGSENFNGSFRRARTRRMLSTYQTAARKRVRDRSRSTSKLCDHPRKSNENGDPQSPSSALTPPGNAYPQKVAEVADGIADKKGALDEKAIEKEDDGPNDTKDWEIKVEANKEGLQAHSAIDHQAPQVVPAMQRAQSDRMPREPSFSSKQRPMSLPERTTSQYSKGAIKGFLPKVSPLLTLARSKTQKGDEARAQMELVQTSKVDGRNSPHDLACSKGRMGSYNHSLSLERKLKSESAHVPDQKVKIEYELSRHQRFTYTQIFNNLAQRSQQWGGIGKVKKLDVKYLRHAVFDCGYFRTSRNMDRIKKAVGIDNKQSLTLEEFLKLMKRVSMATIPLVLRTEYLETYNRYSKKPKKGLSVYELEAMMKAIFQESFSLADLDSIINQWGSKSRRTLNFQQFLSMMAFSQLQNRLERLVERRAFRLFSRGGSRIYWKDIQISVKNMTGKNISDEEAKDMLHEADIHDKGYINKHDFMQLVITVYKPGYVVLWNYDKGKSEVVRLDHLEEDDLEKFDQEIKDWHKVTNPHDIDDIEGSSEEFDEEDYGEYQDDYGNGKGSKELQAVAEEESKEPAPGRRAPSSAFPRSRSSGFPRPLSSGLPRARSSGFQSLR